MSEVDELGSKDVVGSSPELPHKGHKKTSFLERMREMEERQSKVKLSPSNVRAQYYKKPSSKARGPIDNLRTSPALKKIIKEEFNREKVKYCFLPERQIQLQMIQKFKGHVDSLKKKNIPSQKAGDDKFENNSSEEEAENIAPSSQEIRHHWLSDRDHSDLQPVGRTGHQIGLLAGHRHAGGLNYPIKNPSSGRNWRCSSNNTMLNKEKTELLQILAMIRQLQLIGASLQFLGRNTKIGRIMQAECVVPVIGMLVLVNSVNLFRSIFTTILERGRLRGRNRPSVPSARKDSYYFVEK